MKKIVYYIACSLTIVLYCACNGNSPKNANQPEKAEKNSVESIVDVKKDSISYTGSGGSFKSYVAFMDDSVVKPIVLVIPEWWGVNDYTRFRVNELAALGYVAMAVDIYGDGKTADNPADAQKLATPFYKNIKKAQASFDAALAKAKKLPHTDTTRIAVIGYCFGGSMALFMARLGEDLKAVVSFHGDLDSHGLNAQKENFHPAVLVCHGEADSMVPPQTVEAFKKEMADAGINFKFVGYPGATHAFTNPNATAIGQKFNMPIKYNEAADKASWEEMKKFLSKELH